MSEFTPIDSKDQLEFLCDFECLSGYLAGLRGESECGSDKSKSYWHGWRNGRVDGGHEKLDDAQIKLAREVVGTYTGLH